MIKLLLLFFLLSTTLFANTQKQATHILILHSYNQSMSWIQSINRAVYDTLKPDDNGYVIHIENMDTKRTNSKEYLEEFLLSFRSEDSNLLINDSIEDIKLSFDNAVTFGLILNELPN